MNELLQFSLIQEILYAVVSVFVIRLLLLVVLVALCEQASNN